LAALDAADNGDDDDMKDEECKPSCDPAEDEPHDGGGDRLSVSMRMDVDVVVDEEAMEEHEDKQACSFFPLEGIFCSFFLNFLSILVVSLLGSLFLVYFLLGFGSADSFTLVSNSISFRMFPLLLENFVVLMQIEIFSYYCFVSFLFNY
jgi:hypothetical protein